MTVAADWMDALRARVASSSIAQVARELGYSRTSLSLVLAGKYVGSTERIAKRVTQSFDRVECPHLQRDIAGYECRALARKPFNPSSPMDARQWRACQACALNPERKKP